MRVLFVVADLHFSEPLGAMILSAVCKENGHATRLAVLRRDNLNEIMDEFQPDVAAHSCMTPDEELFEVAANQIREWSKENDKRVTQVMGGPHPTFFPEVVRKLDLDAICAGDGERAIIRLLDAIDKGEEFEGIPNVSTQGFAFEQKEIVEDMDAVPFSDRDLIYDHSPDLLDQGIRSFLTQKGCPYKCTYCFNHAYNRMFKGEGRKILRRRTVTDLINEIKQVVEQYPVTRFLRFADDVFVIQKDEWLEEFAERYPKEVGIPFYCLIRCNSLTEEIAQLLSKAGCRSISMSIEAGTSEIRNDIMKRNMPDELLEESFALANKYKLNAFANTILAVPGTTYADDYTSVMFARKLKASCPTFSVFSPFPGTDLTAYAIKLGVLDEDFDYNEVSCWDRSILNNYTEEERLWQTNLAFLGQLICKTPDFLIPFMNFLIKRRWTPAYRIFGSLFMSYMLATRVFPGAQPRTLKGIFRAVMRSLEYLIVFNRKDDNAASGKTGVQAPGRNVAQID